MPICDGTLADWIVNPLAEITLPNRLLAIAQLCNGLAWLYQHGIEGHGDLKPSNVLFRDLRKVVDLPNTASFPSRSCCWQIRVADLGWADAWKDLGVADHDWRPYRAPERYGGVFRSVASDMFAVGVIACELLFGRHPAGTTTKKVNNWDPPKARLWAETGERIIDGDLHRDLVDQVRACLDADPDRRPSPRHIIEVLSGVFAREYGFDPKPVLDLWNSVSDSQIGNSGGLFDEWYSNEIASMGEEHRGRQIERLRSVDTELQDELSWAGVAEWLARAEARARLLAERNGPADQEECRSLAHRVESLVIRRIGSVTAADWLAAWQTGMQAQVFASRVFEGFSELVGRCVKIMEFGSDPGMAQRAFTQVSTFSRSAYHFYFAGVLHGSGQGSIQSALEHLEQAIELNPQESTLYFFKGLWIQGALLVASALGGAADGLSAVDARLCFQRASELDPEWTEPKWELGKLEGK
jgi:hypothetical protein